MKEIKVSIAKVQGECDKEGCLFPMAVVYIVSASDDITHNNVLATKACFVHAEDRKNAIEDSMKKVVEKIGGNLTKS